MNIFVACWAGIWGGVAGLCYGLIAARKKQLKESSANGKAKWTDAKLIIFAVGLVASLSMMNLGTVAKNKIFPPSRLELLSKEMFAEYPPELKNKIAAMSPNEAKTFAFTKAAQGLKRLDLQTLQNRGNLILTIADGASDEVCMGFLTGKFNEKELLAKMEKLPEEKIRQWIKFSSVAIQKEISDATYEKLQPAELHESLGALYSKLDNLSSVRLNNNISTLATRGLLSEGEGCFTLRTVFENAPKLQERQRFILYRLFVGG